jgi:hypothetical protein
VVLRGRHGENVWCRSVGDVAVLSVQFSRKLLMTVRPMLDNEPPVAKQRDEVDLDIEGRAGTAAGSPSVDVSL